MKGRRIHINGSEVMSIQVTEVTNISIEIYAGVEVTFNSKGIGPVDQYRVMVQKQGKRHVFLTEDFILSLDVLEQALNQNKDFVAREDVNTHPAPSTDEVEEV